MLSWKCHFFWLHRTLFLRTVLNGIQKQLCVWVSQGKTQYSVTYVVTWSSRDMSLDHISLIVLYNVPFKEIFTSSVAFRCVKWNLFIFNHILPFYDANCKFPDLSMTSALNDIKTGLKLVKFLRKSVIDLACKCGLLVFIVCQYIAKSIRLILLRLN